MVMDETAEIFPLEDESATTWFNISEERGWGDGLPTFPPTVEAVDEVLSGLPSLRYHGIGPIPPRWIKPSARSIVANAVMAGCRSDDVPVVIAALKATLMPEFNLAGVQATTHPCTPLMFVNGPVRLTRQMNAGTNCLGGGCRATATMGRALRLTLQNIGGAHPGIMDLATHGTPAKFSYCFAENEEESPWSPYHVRHGFAAEDSVVTVVAAEAPHNINDHASSSAEELLMTIAGTIATLGSNNLLLGGCHLLVLSPEHAATLARDGWSVKRIQEDLFDLARVPRSSISPANQIEMADWGREPERDSYRIGSSPEDLHVLVAGGAGKHSLWVPSFAVTEVVSRRVDDTEATSTGSSAGVNVSESRHAGGNH